MPIVAAASTAQFHDFLMLSTEGSFEDLVNSRIKGSIKTGSLFLFMEIILKTVRIKPSKCKIHHDLAQI